MTAVAVKKRVVKAKPTAAAPADRKATIRQPRVSVTEANVRKAAIRLLGSTLVTPEVAFVQRELGASATQDALDAKIMAVRAMPWASIVVPD